MPSSPRYLGDDPSHEPQSVARRQRPSDVPPVGGRRPQYDGEGSSQGDVEENSNIYQPRSGHRREHQGRSTRRHERLEEVEEHSRVGDEDDLVETPERTYIGRPNLTKAAHHHHHHPDERRVAPEPFATEEYRRQSRVAISSAPHSQPTYGGQRRDLRSSSEGEEAGSPATLASVNHYPRRQISDRKMSQQKTERERVSRASRWRRDEGDDEIPEHHQRHYREEQQEEEGPIYRVRSISPVRRRNQGEGGRGMVATQFMKSNEKKKSFFGGTLGSAAVPQVPQQQEALREAMEVALLRLQGCQEEAKNLISQNHSRVFDLAEVERHQRNGAQVQVGHRRQIANGGKATFTSSSSSPSSSTPKGATMLVIGGGGTPTRKIVSATSSSLRVAPSAISQDDKKREIKNQGRKNKSSTPTLMRVKTEEEDDTANGEDVVFNKRPFATRKVGPENETKPDAARRDWIEEHEVHSEGEEEVIIIRRRKKKQQQQSGEEEAKREKRTETAMPSRVVVEEETPLESVGSRTSSRPRASTATAYSSSNSHEYYDSHQQQQQAVDRQSPLGSPKQQTAAPPRQQSSQLVGKPPRPPPRGPAVTHTGGSSAASSITGRKPPPPRRVPPRSSPLQTSSSSSPASSLGKRPPPPPVRKQPPSNPSGGGPPPKMIGATVTPAVVNGQ